MTLQLDVFGEVAADYDRHRRDALECLHQAVPDALEVLVHLDYRRPRDTLTPSANKTWAYIVCKAGLRYERAADWWARTGWDGQPANLATWAELRAWLGGHPDTPAVAAWAGTQTEPDSWRELQRPHELWENPQGWHPSSICRDHIHPDWPNRINAWRTALRIIAERRDGARCLV